MNITTQHIKKGDTFVQYQQKRPITFMVELIYQGG